MEIGKSIIVKGKVQGVFFRASTYEVAERLGLTGWVMNRPDGSVEIEAHGDVADLAELVVWCGTGSEFSHVEEVVASDLLYEPSYDTFEIRY
ncbi:acylphosphatase [Reichenbachiella sp. 5M10]|uniref:acylphosphatase n=1 Tax=Reichenbachiella sp. 5M10 TaxID=1889772 RepID=UPI000C155D0F|nr:acylphosphatase [Reichenbachiella sp. 5M10]